MKYEELASIDGFQRNMRKTPFLKLFPHWWDERDPLITAIGDEVERIKALAIFGLLSAGIKPPVLLWQTSLTHEKYNVNQNITSLPAIIEVEPPLYKTWGDITLTNNTKDDIDGLEITFDGINGFAINQLISQDDVIKIDLTENKVQINNHTIKPQKIGRGMPYFITSQKNPEYIEETPLSNETIRLKINTDSNLENTIHTDIINITEKINKWDVDGEAYQYNPKGADPWIAIKKGSIKYELDFKNITKIHFLYKPDASNNETCILECRIDGHLIDSFTLEPGSNFLNYTIDTKEVNITEIITNAATNETTIEDGTVALNNVGKLEFKVKKDDDEDTNDIVYINDIKYEQESKYSSKCDIDVDINMNHAVFINEQNIEVTGLELIPIERIELYANYDFEYNQKRNGWQKVYQKKYNKKTNVVYDMVTTHFNTKEFYVDVWFKTLQYPYRVGFPCYQAAEPDSMFHVNNRLDVYGETLGLERRLYRTQIPEEEYYHTFPEYYPFDIEQDYWYYRRLISEYTWNDLAINKVDIQDTDGNDVVTLHSINPFCEDFVVHAKSIYPQDKEFIDYNDYYPILIMQQETTGYVAQSSYNNIINLLGNNDYSSSILLNNNSDNNDVIYKELQDAYMLKNNITNVNELTDTQKSYIAESTKKSRQYRNASHISKELITFFNLRDLPENINIDDITITIEAESTDNKKNKFSTEKTGLIIDKLDEEDEVFIPLTTEESYQLSKKSITYKIDDISSLQKIISGTDKNVVQVATIGMFEGQVGAPIRIPFKLEENGIEVDDITEIWLYYNGAIKKGTRLEKDENGKQYIYGVVPRYTNIQKISIECKSETHMPFVGEIDVAFKNQYKDEEEKKVDYQYISGPLMNNEPATIELEQEWHTKDIRNVLRNQGLYFRNVFINEDSQSSTTIILYNIKLEVHYSQKNSDFYLSTYVNIKDAKKPNIGKYEVYIENIGDKPLKTSIDMITPPNIALAKNYIDVDLGIGGYIKEDIEIFSEYPVIDGIYDILTTCNDVVKKDSINVFSDGLLKTNVIIEPHNGKYDEDITLHAEVNTINGDEINGDVHQVQFYINGYAVGNAVSVRHNKAQTTITPGNYKFTGTGTLKLEARYLGSTKYASSRSSSTIFISKNSTRITIEAPAQAMYKRPCTIKAIVEYFNGETYQPVNDGYVVFYVDDEILSNSVNPNYSNGNFVSSFDSLENLPGEYTLKAKYYGNDIFASKETTQSFEIIGGDVDVLVFDENIKPYDNIHLKAKIVDKNNKSILDGYADFICEELNIDIKNIKVINGIASTPTFNVNISLNDDEIQTYKIKVIYHGLFNDGTSDEQGVYNNGEGYGTITVQKSEAIIEYSTLYQASQYEPLGFLVKVKDAKTGEYISNGTIEITLPNQNNLKISAEIDEDGVARLVHNLINFTAKEWQQLTKWSFLTGDTNQNDKLSIINDPSIPLHDAPYDSESLYKIYDGDYSDITLVDFELSIDGKYLQYVGNKNDGEPEQSRNISEYIFIGEDGCLYARTDIDELRRYTTGLQNIIIKFISYGGYKSQTINITNGLNIEAQTVDLDIHSYDLTYTDNDTIICYVTKYDSAEVNVPATSGSVQFILDDKILDTVQVSNGVAILKNDLLLSVPAGNHLLEVDYIRNNKNTTRSYSLFNLRQSTPIINISYDRVVRNKNSQIIVQISSQQNLDIPLTGLVTLYLNDEKIGEQYLYGNENIYGIVNYEGEIDPDIITDNNSTDNISYAIFNYIMPNDVDIPNKYTLKAIYEGNEFFASPEPATKLICEEPSEVTITSEDVNINNNINVGINEKCSIDFLINSSDDIINEGTLYLITDEVVSSCVVSNNIATLEWTPKEIKQYDFELTYDDATHYKPKTLSIHFNSIESVDIINLPDNDYKSIKQALMCLQTDGTIYLNEDIELNKSFEIYKNCNIVGKNDIAVINTAENKINIINSSETHINNVHFVSDNYGMEIINNNYLVINRSILDRNIYLHNNNYLIAQRNFIYGKCSGENSDLNNNWWGSNNPPYNVDNHIIIDVESINKPAIISEEIDIVGKMIGANGREYILPEADFTFGADTGYFSIDFGKTTNHKINTKYFDAEREGNIYFTVDKETVLCPVYEYERKTEVIIDDIDDLPINYQIPIKAKVQSAADIFYKFDAENNIEKSTKVIDNGYISFYIDDKQIGYSPVIDGEAETIVFLTNKYYTNQPYTLKAIYHPDEYYFESESTSTISVVNENDICYVSLDGDNSNIGTFNLPVKTIEEALLRNKSTIYLLDEYCKETNINITHNVTIKSFKNNTKFQSLSGEKIFNIPETILLSVRGIDFSNNETDTLFNNEGTLNIDKCILYKNKKLFTGAGNEIHVKYSAIVNNICIADNIIASWFTYCWFGQNNPDIPNIDNYVQMTKKASKNILYIGVLAHITGMLDTYKHGRLTYKLDEPLPLRIAKFATTYGSMKPIKDYTYNNQSTSLLNTQENNNTKQYIISIPENTNYIEHEVILKCLVTDVHDNNATGRVTMSVSDNNTDITREVNLDNGEGILIISRLSEGTYTLKCIYESTNDINNIQTYTTTSSFVVKKPDIVVKSFDILNEGNLYYTKLKIELEDVFGEKVENEIINIKINNKNITSLPVKNGIINEKILYEKLHSGDYTLSINNYGSKSKYDNFVAYKTLNVSPKDVNIFFDYNNFEVGILNNIDIQILDDENVNVEGGYINIELDGKEIANAEVINGNVNIDNFIIEETGQHSITIHYTGLEGYYNEAIFINNYIGAGIFNVIFDIKENEYISADIGKPFDFTVIVRDVANQLVNKGYVQFYINEILLNDLPIYVEKGKASIQIDLPLNITSGVYSFRLEYIDESDTYLDTSLSTLLEVGKIKTNINTNVIYGAPGQNVTIDYQVLTMYGNVDKGTLIAKYEDNIIGQSSVTENISNQITMKIPFIPANNDYIIKFEYSDDDTYQNSYTENRLIIQKDNVIIEPSHTWYYPNETFYFVATILDREGNRVNTGKAALYIDNVKETESQDVINGQFTTPLKFTKARDYPVSIVYEENDYYKQTSYPEEGTFAFKVSSVEIEDILFKDDNTHKPAYYIEDNQIYSLPNQLIESELIFKTLNNYNVKDGIVDIKIDGNTINSYYVAESNKYINFNIGNLAKGNHELQIIYHDSTLFKDNEYTIPLTILSKQLILEINDNESIIAHNHKNAIDINTILYNASNNTPVQISGLLKYYIGLPIYKADVVSGAVVDTYDYHFIGIQELNNENSKTYLYELPVNLLEYAIDSHETHYKIKVEFIGNNEYDEAESTVNLYIEKQDCTLTINHIDEFLEVDYRGIVNVNFDIDAEGSPLVNFYIDDNLISSVVAENKKGTFSYKLNSNYDVKQGSDEYYTIRAIFDGSAVDNRAEDTVKMHINPLMPIIDTTDKTAFYGGELKLDNVISDSRGARITDGKLSYTLGTSSLVCEDISKSSIIKVPVTEETQLPLEVTYDTTNRNYMIFPDPININVNFEPNDITLDVIAPKEAYRDEECEITVVATCKTTRLPINLMFNGEYQMTEGELTIPLTIPATTPHQQVFTYTVNFTGNQFFNPASKDVEIQIKNHDEVTLNIDEETSATNAQTLEKAIDLVAEHGTIKVINAPANENVTIEKSMNIIGEEDSGAEIVVENWHIINEANISIIGITFNNSTQNAIINNGEITIGECIFNGGQDSAIYIDGASTIQQCTFMNNTAYNGAGIYISNGNYKTVINECVFTENECQYISNEVTGNGSCIYSDKGNDVDVLNSRFYNNNGVDIITSSIYVRGNMYVSSNSFYNNNYKCEIFLVGGVLLAENNLFDGHIPSILGNIGQIDADFNYWGYNDISQIQSKNSSLITLDNWLISSRKDYNKEINNISKSIIVGKIEQYENRFEKEITTIPPVDIVFPVTIGDSIDYLNNEIEAPPESVIKIGQQEIRKVTE